LKARRIIGKTTIRREYPMSLKEGDRIRIRSIGTNDRVQWVVEMCRMYREINLKSGVSLILGTFVIFLIVSCAPVYHGSLTKGGIITTFDSTVYFDIQRENGGSVGEELNVYKVIKSTVEPPARPTFELVETGKVKITEIFDNRIVKAVVISGKPEKGDIVELVPPK
jgi:hypothetical protein